MSNFLKINVYKTVKEPFEMTEVYFDYAGIKHEYKIPKEYTKVIDETKEVFIRIDQIRSFEDGVITLIDGTIINNVAENTDCIFHSLKLMEKE